MVVFVHRMMNKILRETFPKQTFLSGIFPYKKDACLCKRLVVLFLYIHYTVFQTIKCSSKE